MNKCILCGNISTDIDFKQTSGGTPVAKFSIAVNKIKDGVDFIPIVAWNQVAENVSTFCEKGSKVLVEGRLQNNSYEKDGQKKHFTEIVAERIEFLNKKENQYKDMSVKTDFDFGKQLEITDDDMPF